MVCYTWRVHARENPNDICYETETHVFEGSTIIKNFNNIFHQNDKNITTQFSKIFISFAIFDW